MTLEGRLSNEGYNPHPEWALVGLVLLSPFAHLGLSYYLSAAMVSTILAFASITLVVRSSLKFVLFPISLLLPMLLCISQSDLPQSSDVLRVFRELLFLSALICVAYSLRFVSSTDGLNSVLKALCIVTVGQLVLVIVQRIYIPQYIFVSFPYSWYVQNSGTLAEYDDLLYSRIRPSATFGEPSFLGFVCCAFVTALSPMIRESRISQFIVGLLVVTGFMSESLSFALSIFIIGIAYFYIERRAVRFRYVVPIFLISTVLALVLSAGGIEARVSNSIGGTDRSTALRLVLPLLLLPERLLEFPIGQPFYTMTTSITRMSLAAGFTTPPLDNAMFNFLFCYGFFGFVVIGVLLAGMRNNFIRIFFLVALSFNGDFLSISKSPVLFLCLVVFRMSQIRAVELRSLRTFGSALRVKPA